MPALGKPFRGTIAAHQAPFVLGLDGCKAGWCVVRLPVENAPAAAIFETLPALLNGPWGEARGICVDIPIGLSEHGPRACDQLARRALGPKRGSSVFPAPRRFMLSCDSYEEANARGKAQGPGGGLSKQAWNLIPKIAEVDAAITPDDQARLVEGHPEIAFLRLAGEILPPKRGAQGRAARREALAAAGLSGLEAAWSALNRPGVGEDDFLDACALALTARTRLSGAATRHSDNVRDERGFVMEIWG